MNKRFLLNLNKVEMDLYNLSNNHPEHSSCSLVIKRGYKITSPYGLYCIEHDRFMKWIGDEESPDYAKYGIKTVVSPDDLGQTNMMKLMSNFATSNDKSVKVKNLRSGKSIEIWKPFVGSRYHDPSIAEYWKFIDSFK